MAAETLENKQKRITEELTELTVIQEYISDQLAKENNNGDPDSTLTTKITTYINDLSRIRTTLLNNLGSLASNENKDLLSSLGHYNNQNTLYERLNTELEKSEELLRKLKANKNNKTRLAQIGEYEFEKNKEHRSVLKTIVYGSFFILIIIFLNTSNIIPSMLTKIFVTLIASITLLLIIQRLYWNFRRNNIDYGKFSFPFRPSNTIASPSKNNNTLSLRKMLGMGKCDVNEDSIIKKYQEQQSLKKSTDSATPKEKFTNMGKINVLASNNIDNYTYI
tara:strand:- start:38 stop:871 length:834 start_codon:yes stop_codon:yes gene_type:complete